MIFLIAITLFLFWANIKWKNEYYVNGMIADAIEYKDNNVFKIPLRKIYRTKKFSDDDMDIFLFVEMNRFKKVIKYKLVNISDEDLQILNRESK